MLSTAYRLRLESICRCIANKEPVPLEDMIWAEKLAKAHTLARDWLQKARRQASQDIQEGSADDFLNVLRTKMVLLTNFFKVIFATGINKEDVVRIIPLFL